MAEASDCYRRGMNLLLLSLGAGALPEFLAKNVGIPAERMRLGYLNDAVLPFLDAEWAKWEDFRLTQLGYQPITITARDIGSADEFAAILDGLDAIYVAGGETFVLLDNLRRNGLAEVLIEKVRAGLPYIGLSAGAVIAGGSAEPVSTLDNPALAPDLADWSGLGLIAPSVLPHADGKVPVFGPELIAEVIATYGKTHDLLLLNDDQALLVHDDELTVVPSPGPGPNA